MCVCMLVCMALRAEFMCCRRAHRVMCLVGLAGFAALVGKPSARSVLKSASVTMACVHACMQSMRRPELAFMRGFVRVIVASE